MKRIFFFMILVLVHQTRLYGGLVINEAVTETTSDWVELALLSDRNEGMEISKLFVTMYYGANEHLADEPVWIYSFNRPETSYDDRYVIVHLTDSVTPDETERTGDTNRNGHLDEYCNNYYGSLWNTTGVIAIDSDDDSSNGGIIDFCAYSNMDGRLNQTMITYVEDAIHNGSWIGGGQGDIAQSLVDLGEDGLKLYMSIARRGGADTNSSSDFEVTHVQTPGKDNIFGDLSNHASLFKIMKKKVTMIPGHPLYGDGKIRLWIHKSCNLKLRIFSSIGACVFESSLYRSVPPGEYSMLWDSVGKISTGLYIGLIEGTGIKGHLSKKAHCFIIVSRYR